MRIAGLLGQEPVRRCLTEELAAGTISHATLITGPSGSGKRTWAMALALALLCPEKQGADPCLRCASCRSFASGNHPGFFSLEPKNRRILIEQIREIRGKLYYEGASRVCLIHQAEQMTAEAASSLLKILEEPPGGLYFILLAEQPRRLFPTIVSRCRHFSLQPLNESEITAVLTGHTGIDRSRFDLAVRLSRGLPGFALQLAGDPAFTVRIQEAADLGSRLAEGRITPLELLEEAGFLAERDDLQSLLECLFIYFRDGLLRILCRNDDLLLYPGDKTDTLTLLPPEFLEAAMEMVGEVLKDLILSNMNRRLAVEGLLIRLQRRFSNAQNRWGALSPGR